MVILRFYARWGVLSERETLGGLGVGMLLAGSDGGLGWAFGERAIIRQEPPDDACHVASDNDQGIAVAFAFAAMFGIDALEAVVLAVDDERRQIQAVPEDGRATFADLSTPVERVSRVVDAGVEPGIGDV